jgi:hypothetical protein
MGHAGLEPAPRGSRGTPDTLGVARVRSTSARAGPSHRPRVGRDDGVTTTCRLLSCRPEAAAGARTRTGTGFPPWRMRDSNPRLPPCKGGVQNGPRHLGRVVAGFLIEAPPTRQLFTRRARVSRGFAIHCPLRRPRSLINSGGPCRIRTCVTRIKSRRGRSRAISCGLAIRGSRAPFRPFQSVPVSGGLCLSCCHPVATPVGR